MMHEVVRAGACVLIVEQRHQPTSWHRTDLEAVEFFVYQMFFWLEHRIDVLLFIRLLKKILFLLPPICFVSYRFCFLFAFYLVFICFSISSFKLFISFWSSRITLSADFVLKISKFVCEICLYRLKSIIL